MRIRLLLQPRAEDQRIGTALRENADDATALWVLVAWAQQTGLDHLAPAVEGIRDRGGQADAILGVDQGIATYEGLRAALDLFDNVYLFHDGGRSFHPKVYVIENGAQTRAVIGSGNLTEGGLFANYEAATVVDLDRSRIDDEAMRQELRDYFDSFIRAGSPFRELDDQLVDELREAGAITTAAERTLVETEKRARTVPALRQIFGNSVAGLPTPPARQRRNTQRVAPGQTATPPVTPPPTPAPPPTRTAPAVVASWWKKLTRSDAMRKPDSSHQRKYVILGKARHPIDQKTFFKDHFFAGVPWAQQPMRTGRVKELAVVPFAVSLEGAALGTYSFLIDHNEERIANQNNSPTWLNWSSFTQQVRTHDLTDRYLLLERMSDGLFRMTITRTQPSPAVVPPAARV